MDEEIQRMMHGGRITEKEEREDSVGFLNSKDPIFQKFHFIVYKSNDNFLIP